MQRVPGIRNIEAAHRRIASRVHRTAVLHSRSIDALVGCRVLFKCENLQRSGSFKYRGALNAVLSLSPARRAAGVATHSSGNHGAALACVAQQLGVPATIVVPRGGSPFKRAAIRRYGAHRVDCGSRLASRQRALDGVVLGNGASFIPPYDHAAVISGQGTVALEIVDQCETVDEIWVPVGGGGLASGTVISVGEQVQVIGAEPAIAGDAWASLQSGVRQSAMPPRSVADGLRTSLGELNFRILADYDLPIKLVAEQAIIESQVLMMSCLKVLVEPSAAVPLAALLANGPHGAAAEQVVVVITGGNLDPAGLAGPA